MQIIACELLENELQINLKCEYISFTFKKTIAFSNHWIENHVKFNKI